jgi:hypothetical protein
MRVSCPRRERPNQTVGRRIVFSGKTDHTGKAPTRIHGIESQTVPYQRSWPDSASLSSSPRVCPPFGRSRGCDCFRVASVPAAAPARPSAFPRRSWPLLLHFPPLPRARFPAPCRRSAGCAFRRSSVFLPSARVGRACPSTLPPGWTESGNTLAMGTRTGRDGRDSGGCSLMFRLRPGSEGEPGRAAASGPNRRVGPKRLVIPQFVIVPVFLVRVLLSP